MLIVYRALYAGPGQHCYETALQVPEVYAFSIACDVSYAETVEFGIQSLFSLLHKQETIRSSKLQ